ncbi:MAG: amidase [Candidatus Cloacimonetes bacterium]|nr:amidase [Candidatus Cloacimonadota bacterium]
MKYLSECSLSTIINQINQGSITPEKLIEDLCDKLDTWDSAIHAFLPEKGRRKRLNKDIKELYERFPDPKDRAVLFGIPIGVKDIFRVDGFEMKAGSRLPASEFEGKEAASVTRLKDAGAIILGNTVTTEFAYFQPGPTRNPHNPNHTPGGSSSGSAAAVAAGFCPCALGTQTIGSITRPAAYCGVFGFKPSTGRIPNDGLIPFSLTADQIGFFIQDFDSIHTVSSVLCNDWKTGTYLANQKPVIGIPKGRYIKQASETILNGFNKKIDQIRNSGFSMIEVPVFENIDEINSMHKDMISYEFARVHKDWYSQYKELYSLHSKKLIENGNSVTEDSYKKAKAGIIILRDHLSTIMKREGIDIWISPSATSLPPKGLTSTGDPAMSLPWTYAGMPTLSIPIGEINSLPHGLQIAGEFEEDEELLIFSKSLSMI